MIDYLLFGDKKVKIPNWINEIISIKRQDFRVRSRQNLALLECKYNINWHTFLKLTIQGKTNCRYIAYGDFNSQNVTYDMYMCSGRTNIGNVFFRFGNGFKLLCTTSLDLTPSCDSKYIGAWIRQIERAIISKESQMTLNNKVKHSLYLLENIPLGWLNHSDKLFYLIKSRLSDDRYHMIQRMIFKKI